MEGILFLEVDRDCAIVCVRYTTKSTSGDACHTVQELPYLFNSEERRARAELRTQLDGRNLSDGQPRLAGTNLGCREDLTRFCPLPRPHAVVLVEWVLVSHCLSAGDFVPLGEDLRGRILKNGLHCEIASHGIQWQLRRDR